MCQCGSERNTSILLASVITARRDSTSTGSLSLCILSLDRSASLDQTASTVVFQQILPQCGKVYLPIYTAPIYYSFALSLSPLPIYIYAQLHILYPTNQRHVGLLKSRGGGGNSFFPDWFCAYTSCGRRFRKSKSRTDRLRWLGNFDGHALPVIVSAERL